MKAIKAKKRTSTAYFGGVLNLTTDTEGYSAPIGLRSLKDAEARLPMCPDDASPGDVILRRMTRCADADLEQDYVCGTLKPEGSSAVVVNGKLSCICLDLPVRDHYYVVR